jgi:uncharacterized protein YcbK (DUF882 family)
MRQEKIENRQKSYGRSDENREGATAMISKLPAGIFLCLLLGMTTMAGTSASMTSRFFLIGDGMIHIRNAKTGQEAKVSLFKSDNTLNEEGFNRIDEIFGFPGKEKGEHISPRLICMLDYYSDLVAPGKIINLNSGYRSPQYNTTIRNVGGNVARTSQHMDGMAIDFYIDGVDGKELWTIIKNDACCGVGYYGGTDIHLDSARPRFWEAETSKVRTGESDYNQRIYVSTNYDRYRNGEKVRLSLSAVSDFSFGINRQLTLLDDISHVETTAQIMTGNNADCVMIPDRNTSRFIYFALPETLPAGTYRVKMDFCNRPFTQMPPETFSNKIEVLPPENNSLFYTTPKKLY